MRITLVPAPGFAIYSLALKLTRYEFLVYSVLYFVNLRCVIIAISTLVSRRAHTRDGAAENAVGLFALHHCLAVAAAGCSLSTTPACGSGDFRSAYAEHSPAACRCALWRCCFWQLW